MWLLENCKQRTVIFALLCDKEYTVGRKDADILISNDSAVSRKHAKLTCSRSEKVDDTESLPILCLKDFGSRFGTLVNGEKLEHSSEVMLKNGDVVSFGPLGSDFIVKYKPLHVTTSCLPKDSKNLLTDMILKLGGHIVSEWRPTCDFLVMEPLKLTIKTVSALVSMKPIVNLKYFHLLIDSITNRKAEPDFSAYMPIVSEPVLDMSKASFEIKSQRQSLFYGKTFYFFDHKQFKRLNLVVTLAAGKSVLVEALELSPVYFEKGSCVLTPPGPVNHPVCKYLKDKGLRTIPEADIGLAVAYCSTEKYCNPKCTFALNDVTWESQPQSVTEVYAPETQSQRNSSQRKSSSTTVNVNSSPTIKTIPQTRSTVRSPLSVVNGSGNPTARSLTDTTENFETRLTLLVDKREPLSKKRSRMEDCVNNTGFESPRKMSKSDFNDQGMDNTPVESLSGSVQEPPSLPGSLIPTKDLDSIKVIKSETTTLSSIKPSTSFDDNMENLESVVKVEFADLILKKQRTVYPQFDIFQSDVKNFKKFRKFHQPCMSRPPTIIGGRDLVVYNSQSSVEDLDFMNDHDLNSWPRPHKRPKL